MTTPWLQWTAAVTAAEAVGFLVPAAVGATTTHAAPAVGWGGLLLAGAVEGTFLGVAQAWVLGRIFPGLDRRRWVRFTSAAAVAAYALAGAAVWSMTWSSRWAGVAAAATAGALLLLSLGGAQVVELRRHVPRAGRWVLWTAGAWLLALGAFLGIATPLWHEGQPVVLTVAYGALAGVVMAFVQAAVTGWGLLRMVDQRQSRASAAFSGSSPSEPRSRAAVWNPFRSKADPARAAASSRASSQIRSPTLYDGA